MPPRLRSRRPPARPARAARPARGASAASASKSEPTAVKQPAGRAKRARRAEDAPQRRTRARQAPEPAAESPEPPKRRTRARQSPEPSPEPPTRRTRARQSPEPAPESPEPPKRRTRARQPPPGEPTAPDKADKADKPNIPPPLALARAHSVAVPRPSTPRKPQLARSLSALALPSAECEHVGAVNYAGSRRKLCEPSEWLCSTCRTTAGVWACLHCRAFGCDDHQPCAHPLRLLLNDPAQRVRCDVCVVGDVRGAADSPLALLRRTLTQMQTLSLGARATRWGVVRTVSRFAVGLSMLKSRARRWGAQDRLATAVFRWRHQLLARTFTTWQAGFRARRGLTDDPDEDEEDEEAAPHPLAGRTGLRNLGNTCYLNSVTQLLANTPRLSAALRAEGDGDGDGDGDGLTAQLRATLRQLWARQSVVVTPKDLLAAVWAAVPAFQGFQQQDADELLRAVVDAGLPGLGGGELRSTVTCTACGAESARAEPLAGVLPVEVPAEHVRVAGGARRRRGGGAARVDCSLGDCLAALQASERVEGFACGRCGGARPAAKRLQLTAAPDAVVVRINRTTWTAAGLPAKVRTAVGLPLDGLRLAGRAYSLAGVVVHHGRAMAQGHYTALCRHGQQWLHFNDAEVAVAGPPPGGMEGGEAYMAMYVVVGGVG